MQFLTHPQNGHYSLHNYVDRRRNGYRLRNNRLQWEFLFVDELDWDADKFLDTKGGPIILSTMLGFLIGGFLGTRFGSRDTLFYAVISGTVLTVLWSGARSQWESESFMRTAWMFWTFVWAIVGANLLALLMSLTTKDLEEHNFPST